MRVKRKYFKMYLTDNEYEFLKDVSTKAGVSMGRYLWMKADMYELELRYRIQQEGEYEEQQWEEETEDSY